MALHESLHTEDALGGLPSPQEMKQISEELAHERSHASPLNKEELSELTLRKALFHWHIVLRDHSEYSAEAFCSQLIQNHPDPYVFHYLLYSEDVLAKRFRQDLFSGSEAMLPAILENKAVFQEYISMRFDSLDDISQDYRLARALNVNNYRGTILHALLINGLINDTFADLDEYLKLAELQRLNKEIRELTEDKEKKPNPFSGFGKCFENCTAILLSLAYPGIVEHQVKLPSHTGAAFRVADFALLTQDKPIIFEVKSGERLSTKDRLQLDDFLLTGYSVAYVVFDEDGKLAQTISEEYPGVSVISITELADLTGFPPGSPLSSIFSNKEYFHALKESGLSSSMLERDLFAIYYHIVDHPELRPYAHEMIDAVLSQDPEQKAQMTELYGIPWMTQRVYKSIEASYFDMHGNTGKRMSAVSEKLRRAQKKLARLQAQTTE